MRGWFGSRPWFVVVCHVTNGTTTYRLTMPLEEHMRMHHDSINDLALGVVALAAGEKKWLQLPAFCRLAITTTRPEYDPPTAGELGL
ncbi:MAG TPA: hypothetical protein VD866_12120 [Urbifossiella sp.]|nr:hypothetical protein [Urbifossiella sp.]